MKVTEIKGIRFYETPFGKFPSVTSILSLVPKPALEVWRQRVKNADKIAAEAAVIGTVCHYRILNRYAIRQLEPPSVHLPWRDSLEWLEELNYRAELAEQMWQELVKDTDLTPLYVEHTLVSREYRFAGTFDLLARINGSNVLIDLKTSKELWETYRLQLGAYYVLCRENGINVDLGMLVGLHPFERNNPQLKAYSVLLSKSELVAKGKEFLKLVEEFYRSKLSLCASP